MQAFSCGERERERERESLDLGAISIRIALLIGDAPCHGKDFYEAKARHSQWEEREEREQKQERKTKREKESARGVPVSPSLRITAAARFRPPSSTSTQRRIQRFLLSLSFSLSLSCLFSKPVPSVYIPSFSSLCS